MEISSDMVDDSQVCAIRNLQSDVYVENGHRPGVLTYVKFVDNGKGGLLQKFYAAQARLTQSNADAEFFASAQMQEFHRATPVTLIVLERRQQFYDQIFQVNELFSDTFMFEINATSLILLSVIVAFIVCFMVIFLYAHCQEAKLSTVTKRTSNHLFLKTGCIDTEFAPPSRLFWSRVLYILCTKHDLISAVCSMPAFRLLCGSRLVHPFVIISPLQIYAGLLPPSLFPYAVFPPPLTGSIAGASEMYAVPPHPPPGGAISRRSLCPRHGAYSQYLFH